MTLRLADLNLYDVGATIQLVGAIYQDGDGRVLMAEFPGELFAGYHHEGIDLNMDLADWQRFLRQSDILEVEAQVVDKHGKIGKAILRKSQRQIDQRVSWAVFRRDEYRCRYCGNDKVPLTVDHLVLWEDGGPSIEENLVASCKKCNRIRGNTPYREWLNHPYYKKVSASPDGYPPAARDADERRRRNRDLATILDDIPRRLHKRSR